MGIAWEVTGASLPSRKGLGTLGLLVVRDGGTGAGGTHERSTALAWALFAATVAAVALGTFFAIATRNANAPVAYAVRVLTPFGGARHVLDGRFGMRVGHRQNVSFEPAATRKPWPVASLVQVTSAAVVAHV